MKTKTVKTPQAELLIVELPEGTISYQYSSNLETLSAEVPNNKGVSFEQSRIKKGYTLLGKPDEIREEDEKAAESAKTQKKNQWGRLYDICVNKESITNPENLIR